MLKIIRKVRAGYVPHCLIFVFLVLAAPGHAEQSSCADHSLIKISAPDDTLNDDICTASSKALSFLAKYNLHPKRVIKIQIVETAIDNQGYIAFGSYNRQSDLIQLMSFSAVLSSNKSPQMYDQPFDKEHYQGAIAHEIAHAIFQHNTKNIKDQLTNVAQEYLAHSTQLGILSADRRSQIIKANDVGPWESGDSISVTYMGLKPTGFAVKSYLHLTQLRDPQPFIRILLNNNWFFISVP